MYSTINTSIRTSDVNYGIKNRHLGEMSHKAIIATVVAGVVVPVIGSLIVLGIYEAYQIFINNPEKLREQLEMACNVTVAKIENNEAGRFISFDLSTGEKITYVEKEDGVHLQQDNEDRLIEYVEFPYLEKAFLELKGNERMRIKNTKSFNTLEEFQEFRRNDIKKNKESCNAIFQSDWKHWSSFDWEKITLFGTLSEHSGGKPDADIVSKMQKLYALTEEDTDNAFKSLTTKSYPKIDGLQFLNQATLAKQMRIRALLTI